MEAPFSFLPYNLLQRGILAGSLALVLTIALELTCLGEVRKLCTTNRALYNSALWTNVWNNLVLGSITYYLAVFCFCRPPGRVSVTGQIGAVLGIVVIEAILYYIAHKSFHEIKGLYWIHRYHHKFNAVVLPSSANAVSVTEYGVAYMLPLVIGIVVTRADETAAFIGAAVVAVANLLIHTPWLAQERQLHKNNRFFGYPWMLVSAADHLSHHRSGTKFATRQSGSTSHYGAPVLHIDRIVERCSSFHQVKRSS